MRDIDTSGAGFLIHQNMDEMSLGRARLKILTWHVHGSYLYYLSQGDYDIYVPVDQLHSTGHIGRGNLPADARVFEVPVAALAKCEFDLILFQSIQNYREDQYKILTAEQRQLPRIYLEHDPPKQVPTDTLHPVDDPSVLVVHVTHFNRLMWDHAGRPTQVIEHGVVEPTARYQGNLNRGIVVINNIASRGRRLGYDIFLEARQHIPLDIVGMGSKEIGGLGEVPLDRLPAFLSRYRFFFNPIRYTSMGLAVCEAMMAAMPIVGMATTEMPVVITDGVEGFLHTDPAYLISRMKDLLADQALAANMGAAARRRALEKFNIHRFARDWKTCFSSWVSQHKQHRQVFMS